jgi:cell division septal protein FtsQ
MQGRHERWLHLKAWNLWHLRQPERIIALLLIVLSLLFWLSVALLMWMMSPPPHVEPLVG